MSATLCIRADAGVAIGTGHVMRCLALAQAWRDAGGKAEFLASSMPPLLGERLRSEGMSVRQLDSAPGSETDAKSTGTIARSLGAQWIVVDGYQFAAAFQHRLRDEGFKVLFLDDWGHCDFYCADLVLNQNIYAQERLYPRREKHTQVLLGARYALLRREFLAFRSFRRQTSEVARKLLVTVGGADPDDVTGKILDAALALRRSELEIRVLAGPACEAKQQVAGVRFISGANVPEQMAWADIAISGAGGTCLELLFMGVPAAVLIMAENQRPVADELERQRLAFNLGWGREVSSERIKAEVEELLASAGERGRMSQNGRELVDGQGAARVVGVIGQLTGVAAASAGPDRR